jgi:hypothetical protein
MSESTASKKREDERGDWRREYNEELHDFRAYPYIS